MRDRIETGIALGLVLAVWLFLVNALFRFYGTEFIAQVAAIGIGAAIIIVVADWLSDR